MRKCLSAVLLALALVAPARGDSLQLSISTPTWNGSGTSPTYDVGFTNTSGAAQEFYGWQLLLSISYASGPSGTLEFQTATLPTSNYVLASAEPNTTGLFPSGFLTPGSTTFNSFVGDVVSNNTPVSIAAGSTYNLLALTFSFSGGAPGQITVFDIAAFPSSQTNPTGQASGWYTTGFNQNDFSYSGGSDVVGAVSVTPTPLTSIPEPQSLVLLVCGLAGSVVYCGRRRARAR